MKNLLANREVWEEVEEGLLPNQWAEEPKYYWSLQPVRSFLGWALAQPVDVLARGAFEANCLAKDEGEVWYDVKDALLRTFVNRIRKISPSEETGILAWGIGQDDGGSDVLYVDLIGFGQVSFHVFWNSWNGNVEGVENIPDYPFRWTEVRNGCEIHFSHPSNKEISQATADFLEGKEWRGEVHNLFVRAGKNPESLYSKGD